MDNRKRSVLGRDKAANLSHHTHECNRSNISALSTHIAPSDNLQSCLLGCVDVVRNKLLLVDLPMKTMSRSVLLKPGLQAIPSLERGDDLI
jgi:hypothetical protein